MKTKLFFCLPFLLAGLEANAQQLSCGNTDVSYEEFLQMQEKAAAFAGRVNPNSTQYIAIAQHLVGLDNGTGYVSEEIVNDMLAELNRQFLPINVQFYFKGSSFNYYNNSALYNGTLTDAQVLAFCRANGFNTSMNLWAAQTVRSGGNNVGGWSYVAPSSQEYNITWVVNGQMNDDKTTPHEVGHYLGLQHTFNNSTSSVVANRELVTRNTNETPPRLSANCATTGDFICDTDADPYGRTNASVTNCVYTGTVTDANSDLFHPLVNNIMDYNFCSPYYFTTGQYSRMLNTGIPIVTNAVNFTLTAPETVQNAPSGLLASVGDYSTDFNLSWTDNSTVETGYLIEAKKLPDGNYEALKGVQRNTTSISSMSGLIGGNQYTFKIKPSNTKETYSGETTPISIPVLCGNQNFNSCTAYASGDTDANWNIEEVTIRRGSSVLMTNVASNCSTNGIGNFYHTKTANVDQGDVVSITARTKVSSANTAYTAYIKVYVDWNKDGLFDETSEKVVQGTGWAGITGNFTVANVSDGDYRLRVVSDAGAFENISSCTTIWGEIEDYKLHVGTLSVGENAISKMSIYPNPVKEVLHFSGKFTSVSVFAIDGKKVKELNSGTELNVAQLPKGVYVLTAKDEKGNMVSEKFIRE